MTTSPSGPVERLVGRLRDEAEQFDDFHIPQYGADITAGLLHEAANEIERLQVENEMLRDALLEIGNTAPLQRIVGWRCDD